MTKTLTPPRLGEREWDGRGEGSSCNMNKYKQGVAPQYVDLLSEASSGCTTDVSLLSSPIRVPVQKGIKQGDTISPELFTACLGNIMREMDWDGGVLINDEWLTHLRFADGIVLVSDSTEQLQTMLNTLDRRRLAVGLKINRTKTRYMRSDNGAVGRVTVGSDELEEVQKCTLDRK